MEPDYEDKLDPVVILMDNQSTIMQTETATIRSSTKHVQVRFFWLMEASKDGHISLIYFLSDVNFANMFTKALVLSIMRELAELIALRCIPESMTDSMTSWECVEACEDKEDATCESDVDDESALMMHMMVLGDLCCPLRCVTVDDVSNQE